MIIKLNDFKKIIKNKLFETRFFHSDNFSHENSFDPVKAEQWRYYFKRYFAGHFEKIDKNEFLLVDKRKRLKQDDSASFLSKYIVYLLNIETFEIKRLTEENCDIAELFAPKFDSNYYETVPLMPDLDGDESDYDLLPKDNLIDINKISSIFKFLKNKKKGVLNKYSLNAENMSKNIKKLSNYKNFNNIDDFKDYLYDNAGPDIFISFVDPYEKDIVTREMKVPSFSLNPNATFNTPHGIYAYPFDKKNALNFFRQSMPTESDFGTDRKYFHLIRVDLNHPNVIIFNEDGTSNKDMSRQDFIKNLNEMCRLASIYFNQNLEPYDVFNSVINRLKNGFVNKQYSFLSKPSDEKYNIFKNNKYYLLYRLAWYLCDNNDNRSLGFPSEFFSLLLYSVGIKCIVDKNTSITHPNEPSQMSMLLFGANEDFYEYICTCPNLLKQRLAYIY